MEESTPFVPLDNDFDSLEQSDTDELPLTRFEPSESKLCKGFNYLNGKKRTVLAVFIFIILVAVIITVAVLVKTKCINIKSKSTTTTVTTQFCLTIDCVQKINDVLSFMNLSADPCDNFYEYACGGWEKENDIPDTEASWGQFSILTLKNNHFLKKQLNDKNNKVQYKNSEAVLKAMTYYNACMNKTRINSLGAQPMLDLIERLGSWNIFSNSSWNAGSWNFLESLIRIQNVLPSSPFFMMNVDADYLNSSINIIKFDQAGLALTRESYLDNGTDYVNIRKAYKKAMVKIVALLGAEGDNVTKQLMDIYELEEQLANATLPTSKLRNIVKNYKKITIQEFMDLTDNTIDWLKYIKLMFKDYNYPITNDTMVVVHALEYLQNMPRIVAATSNVTLSNFMIWRVIYHYVETLSEDFKRVMLEFNEVRFGTTEEEPLWRQCLSATSSPFGMTLGLLFVQEKFTKKSKEMVLELIHEIREIFIQNLEQVEWMDEKTKRKAEGKARKILENIGYPEFLQNMTALDAKYKGLDPGNEYFTNVLNKSKFFIQHNRAKIIKPVNSKEWVMDPQAVNAYYSFSKNKIVFPAGILQPPFYDKDRPRSLNYGGIGAVVGHEITHGFDDNGRRFNSEGNLRKWWSNHSIEAFTNQTKCLISQYSKYKFFGVEIKGEQTVGENIADNGGVKQAFQAYQKYVAKQGNEQLLPGLNATNDQLFFLGFAQVWCGKFRRQRALRQVANGVHTPGMYRVIGTLSNSEGFAKAFNCPAGSTMNPKKKCQVW